jgi:hypothetical protein
VEKAAVQLKAGAEKEAEKLKQCPRVLVEAE